MRREIILIILFFIIILLTYIIINGISIGNLKVLSIMEIKDKNNYLNLKINEASVLTAINYPENVKTLEETFERYKIQKQKYEQIEEIIEKKDSKEYETKQYDIGYLWRILGKSATTKNLTLAIDVQKKHAEKNLYDLNFNVIGTYVNVIQFIEYIENNSDLYFRIYDFKMTKGKEEYNVVSTFTVKDIKIDPSTITKTI